MDELRVYYRHLKPAGICHQKARLWFADTGRSWGEFVKHGLPVSELEPLDHAFVNRAIEVAKAEAANGQKE